MRPTEAVNGLIRVADAEKAVPVLGHQSPDKLDLKRRKVLYLVDQHVKPAASRLGLQPIQPTFEKISIVREPTLLLKGTVAVQHVGKLG